MYKLRVTLKDHSDLITRFCWSPDGNYICSPSLDGTIRIWQVDSAQLLGTPVKLHRDSKDIDPIPVWKVAWVEKAHCRGYPPLIAVALDDNIICLYNTRQLDEIELAFRLDDHAGPVYSLAWSKDGKYLASGGYDSFVRVWGFDRHEDKLEQEQWSVHSQFPRPPESGHLQGVNTLTWNPTDFGNRYLASASKDGTIIIWDVDNHQAEKCSFETHGSGINSIVWSPDGRYIASSADDGRIYSFLEGSQNCSNH